MIRRGLALAVALGLGACSATNFNYPAARGSDPAYSAMYAYYFEYCAGSSIDKKPDFGTPDEGGAGGHVVFYLNGACRDPSTLYPTLTMCDALPPGTAEEFSRGAGLSMDAHFENANWVVMPSREFLLWGDMKPGTAFTRAEYQRVQWEAEGMRLLDGVKYHADVFDDKPAGMTRRDFKYNVAIGSEYAVGLARSLFCARVPVTRAQMARMIAYLNALNDEYKSGKEEFDGTILQNNCVHLPHNALAAADFWKHWRTNMCPLVAALDFPVPENDFVNMMRHANDLNLQDLTALYDDLPARRDLMTFDRLPMEPGSLAESHPQWRPNDVYNTNGSLIFYDDPLFGSYAGWLKEIFSEPRYYNLKSNLEWFAKLYGQIEANRKPLAWWLQQRADYAPASRRSFAAFYRRFYTHIADDRASVAAKLARLESGTVRQPRLSDDTPGGS